MVTSSPYDQALLLIALVYTDSDALFKRLSGFRRIIAYPAPGRPVRGVAADYPASGSQVAWTKAVRTRPSREGGLVGSKRMLPAT